jgi:putative ABC transport system permease protein
MVLTAGMRLVATGLVIGLAGSLALARLLNSEVFLVPATDPIALAAACLVLTLAALAACWVPARRAARVDPVVALRAD